MNESTQQDAKSPGEYIREELKARDWTQADLAQILNRPLPTVNRILQGKHGLMPEMAIALGEAFGTGPEVWMERESRYRLAQAVAKDSGVSRRARLFAIAPINEMKKRGWFPDSDDLGVIEKRVCSLFSIRTIDEVPRLKMETRKSNAHIIELTPSQRAWGFRVLELAKMVEAAAFSADRMEHCIKALRKLAAYPSEARKVSAVLADHGIRFVVVEHLSGTKIDGATMWHEDKPVIGMSIRYDRIDNFWFTLFHELSHVRHRHESVDADITGHDSLHIAVKPPHEIQADNEAAAALIAPDELKSFILRVGPLYSKEKIIQFAHSIKIHPGIIVGQLHARDEFRSGYKACREMLVKVRDHVTSEALTDGWGQSVEVKD